MSENQLTTDAVREAFEREFGRFRTLTLSELSLDAAEATKRALDELRTQATGKKSLLAQIKKQIGKVESAKRAAFAQQVQSLDAEINKSLDDKQQELASIVEAGTVEREQIDVTIPGRRATSGHLHPITLLRNKIDDVFVSLGYAIEDGAEIETDFYNFTALNIPENHPARSPTDTFYTAQGLALRSQTSTMQIHALQKRRAALLRGIPLRVSASGRVFRRDTPDATHNPMFYQVECLCVDKGIALADLKGTVEEFVRRLFGAETRTRFRASYFPFTEPSMEVDYSCFVCDGKGCRVCKGSGWIELGGSGMVHPNVFRAVDIDSETYTGFAFGFGIDRMSALMYGIDDIRLLYENDVRFLNQFS